VGLLKLDAARPDVGGQLIPARLERLPQLLASEFGTLSPSIDENLPSSPARFSRVRFSLSGPPQAHTPDGTDERSSTDAERRPEQSSDRALRQRLAGHLALRPAVDRGAERKPRIRSAEGSARAGGGPADGHCVT
jgi:hypothetical protein